MIWPPLIAALHARVFRGVTALTVVSRLLGPTVIVTAGLAKVYPDFATVSVYVPGLRSPIENVPDTAVYAVFRIAPFFFSCTIAEGTGVVPLCWYTVPEIVKDVDDTGPQVSLDA